MCHVPPVYRIQPVPRRTQGVAGTEIEIHLPSDRRQVGFGLRNERVALLEDV